MTTLPTRFQIAIVLGTAIIYVLFHALTGWIFKKAEYATGVNWLYLPAGVRLIAVLLFAEAGAVGVLMGSLVAAFGFVFANDPVTAIGGALISAIAPYLSYRLILARLGLESSLANFTAARLLACCVIYALLNAAGQQIWYTFRNISEASLEGFVVMFVGDLLGTLVVVYSIKIFLVLTPYFRS
jgi:hypothetical protein